MKPVLEIKIETKQILIGIFKDEYDQINPESRLNLFTK